MAIEQPPVDSGITVRHDSEGRWMLESPPEGYHTGIALGMFFWGAFMACGAIVVGLMFDDAMLPTVVGAVFMMLGAWGVYRAWISARSRRRITDRGDEIEIGYVVGGGTAFRKKFAKDDIQKLAIQALWKRRSGFLGLVTGGSRVETPAQPHASHLHCIFIRSSVQLETLGFGLADADRHWLLAALQRLVKE